MLNIPRFRTANLRSGILFFGERESLAAREAAVGKREEKEFFLPFSRPPPLALPHFRAPRCHTFALPEKKNAWSQVIEQQAAKGLFTIEQLLYGIPYLTILNFGNRLTCLNAALGLASNFSTYAI